MAGHNYSDTPFARVFHESGLRMDQFTEIYHGMKLKADVYF